MHMAFVCSDTCGHCSKLAFIFDMNALRNKRFENFQQMAVARPYVEGMLENEKKDEPVFFQVSVRFSSDFS